jgi:hypothetical protein
MIWPGMSESGVLMKVVAVEDLFLAVVGMIRLMLLTMHLPNPPLTAQKPTAFVVLNIWMGLM